MNPDSVDNLLPSLMQLYASYYKNIEVKVDDENNIEVELTDQEKTPGQTLSPEELMYCQVSSVLDDSSTILMTIWMSIVYEVVDVEITKSYTHKGSVETINVFLHIVQVNDKNSRVKVDYKECTEYYKKINFNITGN